MESAGSKPTKINIPTTKDQSREFHELKNQARKRTGKEEMKNREFLDLLLAVYRYHLSDDCDQDLH